MNADGPPPAAQARPGLILEVESEHAALPSNMAGRAHQAFPILSAEQIEHLLPFGDRQRWHDGDFLFEAGKLGPGMFVVLSGQVVMTRRDGLGTDLPVTKAWVQHC